MDEYGQLIDAHTVRFERLLPGPIERIWDYLADGSKRGEWFASGDLPAKPGEKFELRFKHQNLSPKPSVPPEKFIEMDKTGHTGKSTLLSFEPPRRLAYTFAEGPDGATDVEFRLKEEAGDKVRLTLTHSKIPNRAYALDVSGGWHAHLAILVEKANGRDPDGFWDVWRRYDGIYDKRYA